MRYIVAAAVAASLAFSACEQVAPASPPLPAPAPAPAAAKDDDVIDDFPAASAPLDQIKLRSIAMGANPTATIELPNGTRHIVKVGSMIGSRLGQVKEIRAGELVVVEEPRDAEGRRHPHEVVLRPQRD